VPGDKHVNGVPFYRKRDQTGKSDGVRWAQRFAASREVKGRGGNKAEGKPRGGEDGRDRHETILGTTKRGWGMVGGQVIRPTGKQLRQKKVTRLLGGGGCAVGALHLKTQGGHASKGERQKCKSAHWKHC